MIMPKVFHFFSLPLACTKRLGRGGQAVHLIETSLIEFDPISGIRLELFKIRWISRFLGSLVALQHEGGGKRKDEYKESLHV